MKIQAQLIDLHERRIFPAEVSVLDGYIDGIQPLSSVPAESGFLMPGFVDAHVHIESSMLPPSEFARLAVVHGTVATVSDPHEIANVLGVYGVQFMLDEARRTPFHFCFGAPSCVPATTFETAGAMMNAKAVAELLHLEEIGYLSEMMNFPGVLHNDSQVWAKIEAARQLNKPVDGHAPGLRGKDAQLYFSAGISTDHECFTYEEGREKALLGVNILIREGSAARNFEALWPILNEFPRQIMFCSDDKHPDDLIHGHINQLAARAIAKGCAVMDVLQAACLHPVQHYKLPVGLLRQGDPADFIWVKDLISFQVKETWLSGKCVARNGQSLLPHLQTETPNHFKALPKAVSDFNIKAENGSNKVRVIKALDGEIVTEEIFAELPVRSGYLEANTEKDLLKIAVVNRYEKKAPLAIGFVQGFGLKKGALASSVAHDSHNIVAVGTDDASLCAAVNAIIESKGGICATTGAGETRILPLPIAGLMSPENGYQLARQYAEIDAWAKQTLNCRFRAPFMVLSFLALPVIPALKITDKGLFDVRKFDFVSLSG